MARSRESCFGCIFTFFKFVLVRLIFIVHGFCAYFAVTQKYDVANPLFQTNEATVLYLVSVKNLQIMAAGGLLLLIFEVLLSSYLRSVDKDQFFKWSPYCFFSEQWKNWTKGAKTHLFSYSVLCFIDCPVTDSTRVQSLQF